MTVWVVLLRGVNVGGHKKLPMVEFRKMLTGLGLSDVATYIQSGNAVFRSEKSAQELETVIGTAIEAQFSFISDVFVMPAAKLKTALVKNPFTAASAEPKSLHVFFLRETDQQLQDPEMKAFLKPDQDFRLIEDLLFLYAPDGLSTCKLAEKLPRFINGSMTARNLRSVQKILELAEDLT